MAGLLLWRSRRWFVQIPPERRDRRQDLLSTGEDQDQAHGDRHHQAGDHRHGAKRLPRERHHRQVRNHGRRPSQRWTIKCLFFLFSSQLVTKWVSEINTVCVGTLGESIPIRLFLAGYEMTPTMRDINKKFSVRYYLNLVLIDEEERRYFKQQVGRLKATCVSPNKRQRELIKEKTRQLKSELVACRSLKKDETKFKLLLLRFWQLMKTRGLPSSVVPFCFNYLFEI